MTEDAHSLPLSLSPDSVSRRVQCRRIELIVQVVKEGRLLFLCMDTTTFSNFAHPPIYLPFMLSKEIADEATCVLAHSIGCCLSTDSLYLHSCGRKVREHCTARSANSSAKIGAGYDERADDGSYHLCSSSLAAHCWRQALSCQQAQSTTRRPALTGLHSGTSC